MDEIGGLDGRQRWVVGYPYVGSFFLSKNFWYFIGIYGQYLAEWWEWIKRVSTDFRSCVMMLGIWS